MTSIEAPVNIAHQGFDDGDNPCVFCGRALSLDRAFIATFTGGGLDHLLPIGFDDSHTDDPGFMGQHLFGATCARKVRSAIRKAGADPKLYVSKYGA